MDTTVVNNIASMRDLVVAVTGASGFVGHHLVSALLERGMRVKVLTRTELPGRLVGTEIYRGDLFDESSLLTFLAGTELLINLAQPAGTMTDQRFALGMSNLARAAGRAGVRRLLHVSTAMVVGVPLGDHVDEASPCRPATTYERQKLLAESIFLSDLTQGVDVGILRPTAVFGVGGKNLLKLLGTVVESQPIRRLLLRFIHGHRHMHLVSVNDVVAALLHLAFHSRALAKNVFLISVDDDADNQYQAVDAILGQVLGRPLPLLSASLPTGVLRVLLRLAGRSQANPRLRFDAGKLEDWGYRRGTDLKSELKQFALAMQAGRVSS